MFDFLSPHISGTLPFIYRGLQLTIFITFSGFFFGFIIGALTGMMRLSNNKIIYGIATVYIELVRGTPILVQALFLYFGISDFVGINFSAVTAGIIAIAINAGAYIAEIVRGGVESIDKGQTEAGRSIGLSSSQTMRYIIWPQAFRRMIPPLGNQFIISLKDTSIFAIISLNEVTYLIRQYVSTTASPFVPYIMLCLAYLVITIPAMVILRRIERKLDV
ncbi:MULTISPECIES: amino acid ABC transporter permease [Alteribacter]|uniref:Amino acid ABC transporter permease n=1 Tax=Alteribacter keqinensis TaxID=2483800 RepID=A0A3M7TRS3_9BACI|nr:MULTISPECIES: amino acid ABC transporter permease [Alteribacter]MBM7095421.1 amino acid ABC transporter permease [Alteribacter salitolerans]RNA67967.1 amino acid ABC transporter permease [Alteribacter keqinensis]